MPASLVLTRESLLAQAVCLMNANYVRKKRILRDQQLVCEPMAAKLVAWRILARNVHKKREVTFSVSHFARECIGSHVQNES